MKIQILQHVSFETPGLIASWIEQKQHHATYTHLYKGEQLPALTDFDMLIVMGGPMGVYDADQYPWLNAEKQFIAQAVAAQKAVLGVCLGSQLIAAALGSRVFPNTEKEIGWFPISFTPQAAQHPLFSKFPNSLSVFHWHGDTFDLPANAQLIASSTACKNQIFTIAQHVVALQCHLEATPELLQAMLANCANELISNKPFIQQRSQIESLALQHTLQDWLFAILDFLESQAVL